MSCQMLSEKEGSECRECGNLTKGDLGPCEGAGIAPHLLTHGLACSVHSYQVNIVCLALIHSLERQKPQSLSLECHHLVEKTESK